MPNKLHKTSIQQGVTQSEAAGIYALRAAIFKQAFMDFENSSQKSRDYVLNIYSKMTAPQRRKELGIAYVLGLRWVKAAEVYDWFHSKNADYWLIDTDLTGADIWRIYCDGSWNRGGIKDKPYNPPKLPSWKDSRLPLPEKYADPLDNMASFQAMINAEIEAARKRKENREKRKEQQK